MQKCTDPQIEITVDFTTSGLFPTPGSGIAYYLDLTGVGGLESGCYIPIGAASGGVTPVSVTQYVNCDACAASNPPPS